MNNWPNQNKYPPKKWQKEDSFEEEDSVEDAAFLEGVNSLGGLLRELCSEIQRLSGLLSRLIPQPSMQTPTSFMN